MKRSIAAFLIVMTTASLAGAGGGTDRENLQKFLSKAAPADVSKSKTPCVCFESGLSGRAGRAFQGLVLDQVVVLCEIPRYSPAGQVAGGDFCFDFQLVR